MIPSLNLAHLKYFYDTALLESVSAAALENFVSQSAISQGIAKLEQALQVSITTHQKQSVKLTEEGKIVFKEAKNIFASIEKLLNCLSDLKSEVSGSASFACTGAIGQYFLALKYLKIRRDYPLVQLNFQRGNLHFIHESLRLEKISFALAVDTPEFDCYEKSVVSTGQFHLYRLKGTSPSNGVFVDHPETFEVMNLRKLYFEAYKKDLELLESLSGWGMIATIVLNGCGIGFLPEFIWFFDDLRGEKFL